MSRPSRTLELFVLPSLVLATGLLVGCSDPAPPEPIPPLVELVRVDAYDVEDRIESTGELKAVERAEIAAEVGGRITEILCDEGDAVIVDQILLRIDPEKRELELDNVRARLAEASAASREAKRERDRIVQLHDRGAASDAQLDAANTSLESAQSRQRAAEAQRGEAERALRDAEVRAPFAALVARRTVSRGEYVGPGTPLYDLVSTDPIEVEFHLPERDSERVSLDQPVALRVAPMPDRVFEAHISMVSPIIDPRTRTLRVEARLPNPEGLLRPGLFAQVDIGVAQRSSVVIVPEESVMQRALGPVVFAVDDEGRVHQRDVRTGTHRRGAVEIVSGIQPGDWVVTSGQSRLLDGLLVRTQKREKPFRPANLAVTDDSDATPL